VIQANGIELQDYRFDAATADTIIALHGIGGGADSFTQQSSLAHSNLNLLAWNMPGYGASPLLSVTSFESLANALLGIIDELQLRRVHLMGHSIGGMVALELAARAPNKVTSLALLATTSAFGGRDDSFKETFLQARLAPLDAGKTMQTLAGEFVPEIVGENPNPVAMTNAISTMQAVPVDTYRAIMACLVTFDRRESLNTISVPCCLIAGGKDSNAPAVTMRGTYSI